MTILVAQVFEIRPLEFILLLVFSDYVQGFPTAA